MPDAARMQVAPPVWIFAIVAWAGSLVLLFVAFRRYSDPVALQRRIPVLVVFGVLATVLLFFPLVDPTTPVPLVAAAGLVILTTVYRRRTNEDLLDVRAAVTEHADITFRRLFTGWLTIGLGGLALIDVARILG